MARIKELEEARRRLAQLEAEEAALRALPPDQEIAERLHEIFHAGFPHCSWSYERWDSDNSSHEKPPYLRMAKKLLTFVPVQVAREIIAAFNGDDN